MDGVYVNLIKGKVEVEKKPASSAVVSGQS